MLWNVNIVSVSTVNVAIRPRLRGHVRVFFRGRRQWAQPSRMCKFGNGSVGHAGCCVSWGRVLAVSLVPSLVPSLLVPGLVPGSIVSSVVANLVPLRHASNLCGPFNLCSLLSAVSLGPPEGATTHHEIIPRLIRINLC